MLTDILIALAQLLPGILPQLGLNSKLDDLIETSVQSVDTIFDSIKSGAGVDPVLLSLQGALAAVEADTSLDPKVLDNIAEAIRVLKAGIAGYQQGMKVEDVTLLTPLPEIE